MTATGSAPPRALPEVGHPAPDFTLTDQFGEDLALSDLRGHGAALLVFYPSAFSGICTQELCALRDDLSVFADAGAKVVAVSCDPMYTLRAWGEQEGYDFPLLSDFWPHGEVAQRYGVFNEAKGKALRGTFLVDTAGILRWSVVNGPGDARDLAAYREAVAALPS